MSKLLSEIKAVKDLTAAERQSMYSLYTIYYDETAPALFFSDLGQKDVVLLLLDNSTIKGFTSIEILTYELDGIPVRVVYSGDTIIHEEYRGEQTLPLAWCKFIGKVKAENPNVLLYWLLLTKGHRTYRYLPLFFKNYHPSRRQETCPDIQRLVDFVATDKFGDIYDKETGTLTFERSLGQLKSKWCDAEECAKRNKEAKFFLSKNPHYAKGVELITFTELSEENMRSFALKGFQQGISSG